MTTSTRTVFESSVSRDRRASVTAVVIDYRNPELVGRCLSHLLRADPMPADVVVVDVDPVEEAALPAAVTEADADASPADRRHLGQPRIRGGLQPRCGRCRDRLDPVHELRRARRARHHRSGPRRGGPRPLGGHRHAPPAAPGRQHRPRLPSRHPEPARFARGTRRGSTGWRRAHGGSVAIA